MICSGLSSQAIQLENTERPLRFCTPPPPRRRRPSAERGVEGSAAAAAAVDGAGDHGHGVPAPQGQEAGAPWHRLWPHSLQPLAAAPATGRQGRTPTTQMIVSRQAERKMGSGGLAPLSPPPPLGRVSPPPAPRGAGRSTRSASLRSGRGTSSSTSTTSHSTRTAPSSPTVPVPSRSEQPFVHCFMLFAQPFFALSKPTFGSMVCVFIWVHCSNFGCPPGPPARQNEFALSKG